MQLVDALSILFCFSLVNGNQQVYRYQPFGVPRERRGVRKMKFKTIKLFSQLTCSLIPSSDRIDSKTCTAEKKPKVGLLNKETKSDEVEQPKLIAENEKKELPNPVDFDGLAKMRRDVAPLQAASKTRRSVAQSTLNFASQKCGAKVIAYNGEAINAKGIIDDDDVDYYLLNACEHANKFAVIELCKSIQIARIAIGNFEFFASGPKKVIVQIAEKYPIVEWSPLGSYELNDTKKVQTFDVPDIDKFAKFVKIFFEEHHGNEYYCTVSVVKVMGTTILDNYMESTFGILGVSENIEGPEVDEGRTSKTGYFLLNWIVGLSLFWLVCGLLCNLLKLD